MYLFKNKMILYIVSNLFFNKMRHYKIFSFIKIHFNIILIVKLSMLQQFLIRKKGVKKALEFQKLASLFTLTPALIHCSFFFEYRVTASQTCHLIICLSVCFKKKKKIQCQSCDLSLGVSQIPSPHKNMFCFS